MKLHTLHVHNLNSLRGNHSVQFETLFAASNILLIAGETGAGKSTLLDAIHLALFGKTPRLQDSARTTRAEETSVQHVMTRGTGECSATLEFSVLGEDGTRHRYKALWSLHRAHRKADGRVQEPSHSFARYDPASDRYIDMLESGEFPSTSAARTHALGGMSEEDFLRSVLLPQGQFDALLTADEKTRADALKRIVSVEHIEAIGAQVAEHASNAKRALEDEQARLGAQQEELLADDARRELEAELLALAQTIETQSAQSEQLQARVEWAGRLQELSEQHTAAQTAFNDAAQTHAAAAPERDALKEHQRLHDAWNEHLRCEEFTKNLTIQRSEVSTLEESATERQKDLQHAEVQRAAAETALTNEQTRQEEQKPTLDAAHKAWETHQKAVQKADACDENFVRTHAAYIKEQKDLEARKTAKTQAESTLETLNKTLEDFAFSDAAQHAHPNLDGLLKDLSALRATYQASLDPLRTAHERLKALSEHQATLKNKAQTHKAAQQNWVQRALDFYRTVPWVEAPPTPHADTLTLSTVLGWRDQLEGRREDLKGYGQAIGDLLRERKAHADCTQELRSASQALDSARTALENATEDWKKHNEACATQQNLHAAHKELVVTQKRYLELVEELHNTDTCPVCGTHSPPKHAAERRKDVEAKMQAAQKSVDDIANALKIAETARDNAARAKEQAGEQQTQAATRQQDLNARLKTHHEACKDSLAVLKSMPLYNAVPVQDGVDALAAQIETLRNRWSQLNQAHQDAKTLYEDGRTHHEDAKALARDEGSLNAQQTLAENDLKDATRTHEKATTELQSWTRRARTHLDTPDFVRWQKPPADSLDADIDQLKESLEDLHSTWTRYQEALQQHALAEQRIQDSTQEYATQQKDTLDAHNAHSQARKEKSDADTARDNAQKSVQRFFEGKDPRSVETQWQNTLDELRKTLEGRRTHQEKFQRAYNEAHRAWNSAQTLANNTQKSLETQQEKRHAALEAQNIPDVETLKARRLSPERAKELQQKLNALDVAKARTQGALESAKSAYEQHLERKKTLGESSDEDASVLLALRKEVTELHERRGRLQETLSKDAKRKQALQAAAETLDKLQREHNEWDLLRQLIGLNKGEAFSRYALALSLGELIAHANEQLAVIAPRYTLKQRFDDDNIPQIDFEILDHDFTSDVRPISNLSGGERFQLSLAMALGLSSMSRSILPIETLLIDEGFGTLDPIALDQAIQTLEGLYLRTGARVALISHVERLRERLPTQIIVRKRGGGHSTLEASDGLSGAI